MADITFTYTPTAGSALDASGIGANVWSLTAGASLYGELNGNLEDENFSTGMRIASQHIRPNEGFITAPPMPGLGLETLDYVDLLFGWHEELMGDDDWVVVAGTGKSLYVPWDATAVVYAVSAFVTNQRSRQSLTGEPEEATYGGPEMYIRMRVDGVAVEHTLRPLPYTLYPTFASGKAKGMVSREHVLSHHFDLTHLATSGSEVTKGYHRVALEVLIPRTLAVEYLYPMYTDTTAVSPPTALHAMRHRIRMGIRKSHIIAL